MAEPLSLLRAQLNQAPQQLAALLELCLGRESLLPGSMYTLRRKCGKPNCHCARGELHESTILSYRGQGRPKNISLPPERIDTLRKMTDDYRRFRQTRAKIVRWQRELLKLLDALQAARVQLGEAAFLKGRSLEVRKPRRSRR